MELALGSKFWDCRTLAWFPGQAFVHLKAEWKNYIRSWALHFILSKIVFRGKIFELYHDLMSYVRMQMCQIGQFLLPLLSTVYTQLNSHTRNTKIILIPKPKKKFSPWRRIELKHSSCKAGMLTTRLKINFQIWRFSSGAVVSIHVWSGHSLVTEAAVSSDDIITQATVDMDTLSCCLSSAHCHLPPGSV